MKELTIKVDDKLVKLLGYSTIEQQVQDFTNRLYLKISAQEMLKEIQDIDIENDPKWHIARELAWKQESQKYLKTLQANA